jgi:uncharacterized membrane protein
MRVQEESILQEIESAHLVSRRKLLPVWIKVFIWIFMIMGGFTPLVFLIGLAGGNAELSLFGLQTNEPFSAIGLTIIFLFLFKGIAAFGLWTEKDWGIRIAKIDALISITVCCLIKIMLPLFDEKYSFGVPLELVLLIPYFVKLKRIEKDWERT